MQNSIKGEENSNTRVGSYLLGKTIGAGTFGKVKIATHLPTGQQVAIKIIVKSKIAEVADFERVSREMHILRIVRHPSIIQLYEIIQTKEYLFLVTQLAERGELFALILKNGRLPEVQACRYFQQLISAIKYLHDLRIAHRDLKLQNLLVDQSGSLKVIDFGLSNTYHEHQLLQTACGSPCYAAPEMIAGKKYNGLVADLWSCGIILFAMVCGFLPFQDQNTATLYSKIKKGTFYLPSNVSNQFRSFITSLLQVDPSKRMAFADIISHSWFIMTADLMPKVGIKVGSNLIVADEEVLSRLKQMGFEVVHTQNSVEANRQGTDLAAYYLQMKKMRKQGYQSAHDINSINYKPVSFKEIERQSFDNTRKSYYFGINELSPLRKRKEASAKKEKISPQRFDLEVKRKTKIKFPTEEVRMGYSGYKPKRGVSKGNTKVKGELASSKKNKKKQFYSQQSREFVYLQQSKCRLIKNQKSLSSNKKKVMKSGQKKHNKSCNLITAFRAN